MKKRLVEAARAPTFQHPTTPAGFRAPADTPAAMVHGMQNPSTLRAAVDQPRNCGTPRPARKWAPERTTSTPESPAWLRPRPIPHPFLDRLELRAVPNRARTVSPFAPPGSGDQARTGDHRALAAATNDIVRIQLPAISAGGPNVSWPMCATQQVCSMGHLPRFKWLMHLLRRLLIVKREERLTGEFARSEECRIPHLLGHSDPFTGRRPVVVQHPKSTEGESLKSFRAIPARSGANRSVQPREPYVIVNDAAGGVPWTGPGNAAVEPSGRSISIASA